MKHKMSSQFEECCVCTDPLMNLLPCGHAVHTSCIAKAGQNLCPVCRVEVQFDEDDQALYEHHARLLQEEKRQQEQQASAQLARQLQQQEMREVPVRVIRGVRRVVRRPEPESESESEESADERPHSPIPQQPPQEHPNTQSFVFGHRRFRIIVNEPDDAISEDNLAMALNSLMYHVNNNDQNFEADSRAIQLYAAVLQLNSVSALSGLSVTQLTNVINLST
jgi:hypothetical protein